MSRNRKSRRTPFAKAMNEMKALGAADFLEGKSITAFPGRQAKNKLAARLCDRFRAAYEMGWRGAKEEQARMDFAEEYYEGMKTEFLAENGL